MTDSFDDVFDASFRRVLGEGAYNPAFTDSFYRHFLGSSDEVAARFANTDMGQQKTMLHDSLLLLVEFNRSRRLSQQMSRLAEVHSQRGQDIPAPLYELWLDALIATVRERDSEFDEQVELAWRLTLAPGIAYLTFGYDHPLK
jgi:hemoglobin-like flavoprotein